MPMKTRRLITQIVVYVGDEPIALLDVYLWWRKFTVYAYHRPRESIRRSSHPVYAPVVSHCFGDS